VSEFQGFVDVAGGRLWAQAAGEGSGVVLVHAGVADARMWDPQWDALAARHRVVRYDTRGFGRSESTDDAVFSNRADLVAVMGVAGLERATLVGCSRAGSIAVDTALEFPDRVAGLVWVCGGLSGLETTDTPEERHLFEREEALVEAKDWEAAAEVDLQLWVDGVGQPAGRAPAVMRAFVRRMMIDTWSREPAYGRPIVLDPPAAGRLGSIRCPTLAIVGELDPSGTGQAADALVAGVHGSHRIDLPGVAHLPSLERPQWFTETLLAFLAEVG
jgi:pimeloyl-ACP methyl ester carboxylesterase